MLDIEFLQSENPQLKKVNFYFLEHALFLNPFLEHFRAIVEKRGAAWHRVQEHENILSLLSQDSLFGEECFVVDTSVLPEDIEAVVEKTQQDSFQNRILFLLNKEDALYKKLEKGKNFSSYVKNGRVFEEVEYSKNTYSNLFSLFLSQNKIKTEQIANYPLYVVAVEETFKKSGTIFEFWSRLDFVINTCVEKIGENSHAFDVGVFRKLLPDVKKTEYFKMHEMLYRFLAHPQESTLLDIFSHCSEIYEEGQSRKVIDAIYRCAFELLQINSGFEKGKKPEFTEFKTKVLSRYTLIPLHNLFQFLVRFSEIEPRLNRGDFLTSFHKFLLETREVIK